MEHIDKIFYINLDHRTDRKQEILAEFSRLDIPKEKIQRFPAVRSEPGCVGCGLSHLNLLKHIRSQGYTNTIILEDDFDFLVTRKQFDALLSVFFRTVPNYAVTMLAYNLKAGTDFNRVCGRALDVQTASGYMIHKDFLDTLINHYTETQPQLEITRGRVVKDWNDQSWKVLQPHHTWLFFKQRIGKQRKSYSDIEKSMKDYGV